MSERQRRAQKVHLSKHIPRGKKKKGNIQEVIHAEAGRDLSCLTIYTQKNPKTVQPLEGRKSIACVSNVQIKFRTESSFVEI